MNLLLALFGNASQVSPEKAGKKYGRLLMENEPIKYAYKLIRDYLIFTTRRLILVDVQGIFGKKVAVQSIPYKNISRFSVETAGVLDLDSELKIWLSGANAPVVKKFTCRVDIYEIQAILADAVAGPF